MVFKMRFYSEKLTHQQNCNEFFLRAALCLRDFVVRKKIETRWHKGTKVFFSIGLCFHQPKQSTSFFFVPFCAFTTWWQEKLSRKGAMAQSFF
jgi:hypothetical protein